jgi:hypothetical protein
MNFVADLANLDRSQGKLIRVLHRENIRVGIGFHDFCRRWFRFVTRASRAGQEYEDGQ